MELSTLRANPTAEVELIHPLEGPTGVFITLASRDHPDVRAVASGIADKRLAMLSRRGGKAPKFEDMEAESLQVLLASVQGWRGIVVEGEPWPCTPENIRTLLGGNDSWIRRQLNAAQEDEALFFEK